MIDRERGLYAGIALTRREWEVVAILHAKRGHWVTLNEIARTIYTATDKFANGSVRVYVARLRRKLEGTAEIEHVRGCYRLRTPALQECARCNGTGLVHV